MRVIVEAYNSQWPAIFESIRDELATTLANVPVVSIEHVGSTSVPGLCAKPIIDIDVVVSRENVTAALAALTASGYEHMGELGIEDRHALRLLPPAPPPPPSPSPPTESPPPPPPPARNLYVCVDGCASLRNHLGVRKVLREDPVLRAEYAAEKERLAMLEWQDVDEYVEGKSGVLQRVLEKAGFGTEEREKVRQANVFVEETGSGNADRDKGDRKGKNEISDKSTTEMA